MTEVSGRKRQPKGAPASAGGEFAGNSHDEASSSLARRHEDCLPAVKGVDFVEDPSGSGVSDGGVRYKTFDAHRTSTAYVQPTLASLTVYADGTIYAQRRAHDATNANISALKRLRDSLQESNLSDTSHPYFTNKF